MRRPTLIHAFAWTLLGKFSFMFAGFVASGLMNRALGPSGRGLLAEVQTWAVLFAAMFGCSCDTAIYHFANRDRYAISDGARLSIVVIASGAFSTLAVAALGLLPVLRPNLLSEQAVRLLPVTMAYLPATLFSTNLTTLAQALGRVKLAAGVWMTQAAANIVVVAGCFFSHAIDVRVAMYILTAVQFVGALGALAVFLRTERVSLQGVSKRLAWAFVSAGLKVHIATVSTFVYTRVNQLLVSHYCGDKEAGLFAAAFALAFGLFGGFSAFQTALYPRVLHHSDDFSITIRSIRLTLYGGLLVTIPLLIGAPIVLRAYSGGQFEAATPMFRLLVLSAWTVSISQLASPYWVKAGTFWLASSSAVVVAVASVIANFVLVPSFQGLGAAAATLVTMLVGFSLVLGLLRLISGRSPLGALLPDFREEITFARRWFQSRAARAEAGRA
jgi:O-antigen/teichoic acid export membrane protein